MKVEPLKPVSLRTQLIIMILGVIILVQASTYVMMVYLRHHYVDEIVANYLTTSVRILRSAIREVPPEEQNEFIRDVSSQRWYIYTEGDRKLAPNIHFISPLQDDKADSKESIIHQLLREFNVRHDIVRIVLKINDELKDTGNIGLSEGKTPRLYIPLHKMDIDGADPDPDALQEYLSIPLDRLNFKDINSILTVWIFGTLVLIIFCIWFALHVTRPLKQLRLATERLAEGDNEVYVDPGGPSEVYGLGESFNHMLQSLNESNAIQRTLLGGLPHDLKSPLARMRLRVELSDDENLKNNIRQDISEMQAIITQFMDFVRGSDVNTYHFETVDMVEWLNERVLYWQEAGTPVELYTELQSVWVSIDLLAMARVLDNLISNAMKYARPPFELGLVMVDDDHVKLSVRDHGDGIPALRRQEVVRAFSRLDSARTITGSAGLGLAVVSLITQKHDGVLELDNAPDGGLIISVTLPVIPPPTT